MLISSNHDDELDMQRTLKADRLPPFSPALALEIRGDLTQAQMAALVGYRDGKRWSEFEQGTRTPGARSWELALIKRNRHPLYGAKGKGKRDPLKPTELPVFSPAMARDLRGERTQAEIAALVGYLHGDRWSEFETGVRRPSRLSWELALIKCDRHPQYGRRSRVRSV